MIAVKNDHQSTIRVTIRREPNRSPHRPAGISNKAYASANALKIIAFCVSEMFSSF